MALLIPPNLLSLGALVLTFLVADVTAQEIESSEDKIKAAYLVNFPKYVNWPAEAFAGPDSPIVFAVLADIPLTEEIRKLVAGRTVNGRSIVLEQLRSGEKPGVCHMLFVSAEAQRRSPNLVTTLMGSCILTVGESADFLDRGGIINLAVRNRALLMEVNLASAGDARIEISSKLLALASVVKGKSR
jgi:hypothetical protein